MYLLLNLSAKDHIKLSLFNDIERHDTTFPGQNKNLLKAVEACLEAHGQTVNDIQGIMTVVGTGTFTSTRLSAVVANTFAYVMTIPVLSLSTLEAEDPQTHIRRLLAQVKGQYVSATYSGEPNIGWGKGKIGEGEDKLAC